MIFFLHPITFCFGLFAIFHSSWSVIPLLSRGLEKCCPERFDVRRDPLVGFKVRYEETKRDSAVRYKGHSLFWLSVLKCLFIEVAVFNLPLTMRRCCESPWPARSFASGITNALPRHGYKRDMLLIHVLS